MSSRCYCIARMTRNIFMRQFEERTIFFSCEIRILDRILEMLSMLMYQSADTSYVLNI